MKKIIVLLIISSFLLLGCSEQAELPPEPGSPDAGTGVVGQASEGFPAPPPGFADAQMVF